MKLLSKYITSLFLVLVFALPLTAAALPPYIEADCTDNTDPTTCGNTNVVMVTGFVPDPDLGLRGAGGCSGSLLKQTDDMMIILTAGHCAALYLRFLKLGVLVDVGVSFDAEILNPLQRTADQFILGGQPVLSTVFPAPAQKTDWLDYGLIVFELDGGEAERGDGAIVDVSNYDEVVLPPLDYFETLDRHQDTWISVGYGVGSNLHIPGEKPKKGPKAQGGQDLSTFGTRHVGEDLFIGFMEKNQYMVHAQSLAARGYGDKCGGNSGGPQFKNIGKVKTQISISSQGICGVFSVNARLDIPQAHDFIQTCAYDADTVDDVKECPLGCIELVDGVCPQ